MKCLGLLLLSATSLGRAERFPDCAAQDIVSRIGHSTQEDAPTPAPSTSHACSTETSNARGYYTTTRAPCIFQFHKSESEDVELIDYRTSDLCSDDNGFLTVKEYVTEWPDECVGDFRRCYSLEHHQAIMFDFLCLQDWKAPEGTTHMSVDCTEDKELVLETSTQQETEHSKEEQEARLETYELKLFNWVLLFGFSVAGVYAISQLIVKPVVACSSSSVRAACSHNTPVGCNCGTPPTTNQETLNLVINSEESSSQHDHNDQVEQEEHFEMQVPADFDAVPMVPATVLHDEH
jgi:hypothetical protein